jgi:HEAT repeat protein
MSQRKTQNSSFSPRGLAVLCGSLLLLVVLLGRGSLFPVERSFKAQDTTSNLVAFAPGSAPQNKHLATLNNPQKESFPAEQLHSEIVASASEETVSGKREEFLALLNTIQSASAVERADLARRLQILDDPEFGPDILAFLIRNADDPILADEASAALARIIAPDDLALLNQALPSTDTQGPVREYLLSTLSQIRNPAAVDVLLLFCASSKDSGVYLASAAALGAIGNNDALAGILSLIDGRSITDISDPLVLSLISAANKDARQFLQDAFLHTTNSVVQYATAYALAVLSNQASQTTVYSDSEHP